MGLHNRTTNTHTQSEQKNQREKNGRKDGVTRVLVDMYSGGRGWGRLYCTRGVREISANLENGLGSGRTGGGKALKERGVGDRGELGF